MALLKTNTGIGTTNPTSALHVFGDGLFTGIVTATTFSGQINSGVGTFTNLTATNATLTNINSSGITTLGVTTLTRLTAQSINSSGIVTGSTFRPSSGYIQSPNGTNSFYIYDGTGNVAFQGTIGASQVNNSQGYKVIGFAGTNNATFENHLYVSGITTSIGGFVGNLVGIASTAILAQTVNTVTASDTPGTYHLTFVNSHNASATAETLFTDDGIYYNPGTNTFTTQHALFTGDVNVSGITSLAGNVYLGNSGSDTITVVGVTTFTTSNVYINNQLYVGAIQITGGAIIGEDITARHLNLSGIATVAQNLDVNGGADIAGGLTVSSGGIYVNGISTFANTITGTISTATKLENSRTFEITGDVVASAISFDGTGNVSLAATIQPNSVGLGTDTFGDYVKDISGTANEIIVTGGTGEGSSPIIGFAPNPTIGGNVTIGNDLQVNNNLNVTGNITVGGTAAYIIVQDFRVTDADIILGFTTDAYGNDVSTDTTANHGGIAIASTEGYPLVQLVNVSIGETLPATYKKFMWFEAGSFAGLNTDAWLSNYAIGIGSTQFPSGTRLAAGSVQFSENDLTIIRNINASGVITAINFIGTASTASFATTAFTLNGVVEKDLNVAYAANAGVATYAVNAGIATYANNAGIATYAVNAGIATYADSAGISTYATSAGIATYASLAGVATYADSAGVSTSVVGGVASVTQLNVSGISTLGVVTSGNIYSTGIVTALNFVGSLTGTASTASFATTAFTLNGVFEKDLNVAYAANAGVATYAVNAGVATYADSAGIATYAGSAGVSTSVIGGIASVTELYVSGITTLGIVTVSQLYVSGVTTSTGGFVGNLTGTASTASFATTAYYLTDANNIINGTINVARLTGTYDININGNATTANYATLTGIATYADNAGISTYATLAGIATYATSAGIASYADNAGIATYATLAGIATYATSAGVSTSVIGGIASVTQLNVSGVTTSNSYSIGSTEVISSGRQLQNILSLDAVTTATIESAIQNSPNTFTDLEVTGISTLGVTSTTNLTTQQLNVSGLSTFSGITTYTEIIFGTQASFTGVVTASSFSGNATSATYATLAGVATYADSAGIATYASISGIATYATLAGIATYATLSGIASYADNAGISTNLKGGVAGNVPYQSATDTTTFVSNGTPGQVLLFNGSVPIWGNVSAASGAFGGITIQDEGTPVGTANSITTLNFVSPNLSVTATSGANGISTITLLDYVSNAGVATYASVAGIATYASVAGIATYATNAGVATYADNAGIATYATNAGVATYATNAGVATYASVAGIATYADVAGISTSVIGGIGSITQLNVSGVSTLGSVEISSGIITATSGIVTYYGDGSKLQGIVSVAGISVQDEGNTVGTSVTTLNFSGASVSISNASGGISTVTIIESGIATYADNAGITTNLKGGVAGNVPYQSATDTTAFVTNGLSGQVLLFNGSIPIWGNVSAASGAFGGISVQDEGTPVGTANSITTLDFRGNNIVVTATSGANGISTITLSDYVSNAGVATYASNAGVATALQNSRTFEITGDIIASPISFNGTGNVSLAATIQPNSVGLGTDTTGDYVRDIAGTSNQITVTGGTGEGSTPTLSIPNQFTAPQDVEVTRDLQVNRNLNVNGNITIGGTSATLFTSELKIYDPDIVLGFRTDAFGNDISTDSTANHGGIAIASTEGYPLVQLFIAGIETNPATYKKIMWFKAGEFAGLGTDAWLMNYAVGIGSTQFPTGTRLAAGNVQFNENDLAVVRNINASGIVTATDFNSASDAKLKTNIEPIANPLEKVIQIQGVSFNWIKDNKPSMGVIADELQKVLPELVSDTDPKTVNYNGLIGLLIESVKQQQIKIQSLEKRISRLE